jgi:LmbE family N-acetylglucosaminyl deacetylase
LTLLFASLAIPAALAAQTPDPAADHGAAALHQSLLKLSTTASLLQVTAHPDDEDGGLLTLLSRSRGVRVGLVTLTRGEGGQNKIGPELFDALGITRTEELLASGRFYGLTQFFTRAVDYGYSKTLTEALTKWRFNAPDGGPAVEDVVRVIRIFRPEVLVARFSGTSRDGHAHHQASAIVARKAFEEAGDPSKFPEQIRGGLLPWKPRKLYVGIVRKGEDWSVSEDVGAYDPLLGLSYSQLAWQGLSRQRTQGVGQVPPDAGPRTVYYKRIDGTSLVATNAAGEVESPFKEGGSPLREAGFFDGLDESLPGIARRLGSDGAKIPGFVEGLGNLEALARGVLTAFSAQKPESSAADLGRGLALVTRLVGDLSAANVSAAPKAEALFLLRLKEAQFREALNRSLSLDFQALVEPEKEPGSPFPGFRFAVETMRVAVPGASFPVSATLVNRSSLPVRVVKGEILLPEGWRFEETDQPPAGDIHTNEAARLKFRVTAAGNASPTAPYWSRASLEEAVYSVSDPALIGKPLPDFPAKARIHYQVGPAENFVEAVVNTRQIDPLRGELKRELAVEPALSLKLSPQLLIVPLSRVGHEDIPVEVDISNNAADTREGTVRLEAPEGWKSSAAQRFSLAKEKDAEKKSFTVAPSAGTTEGLYAISARADSSGAYNQTLTFLDHPDIGSYYDLKLAASRVEVVNLQLPKKLRVGYVAGAEDTIPDVLQQLELDLHLLSSEDLEKGDLARYDTIVTGPRAYDVRDDLRRANGRLLEYVHGGGRLVVQYNSNIRAFNAGNYFPFPAKFPDENLRIVVEDSPVVILNPADPIWNFPNKITATDFDGWVQERGLYFVGEWSLDYSPLLSLHDPGEEPVKGGMLVARYGKGTYIFTGLSWFREIPEGVPGALRIFANLISPQSGG